ncbi:MAG: class I SAM-dependent methyltransferase [Deltaproteobacteria bacterium]|nr:class I SAM-dependent methyltransferase [Deltaproteobacteria bacterium]
MNVREQYERHPYPAVPWIAVPKPLPAHVLAYELGQNLRTARFVAHERTTRILVAGCGSLEPVVVAAAHPRASVTAVDLSGASLKRLRLRALVARVSGRIETRRADLLELSDSMGPFDYILSTGMLHHCERPGLILAKIAALLAPRGIARVMTYAARSRHWIYEVRRYFESHGLRASTPNLARRCRELTAALPPLHPLRTSFETYADSATLTGLVDGFFHAYDHPVPVSAMHEFCARAGLKMIGLGHARHSQPAAFEEALARVGASARLRARYQSLSCWRRLELLDDLCELAVNPVYWLAKTADDARGDYPKRTRLNPVLARGRLRKPLSALLGLLSVPAPLLPAEGALVADEKLRWTTPRAGTETFRRWAEGGWLLSDDGTLAPPLLAQRERIFVDTRTPHIARATAAGKQPPHVFKDFPRPDDVPERAHRTILEGLARAVEVLGCTPETIRVLSKILEPRARALGDGEEEDLPWLSSGDVLRDLLARGFSEERILESLTGQRSLWR